MHGTYNFCTSLACANPLTLVSLPDNARLFFGTIIYLRPATTAISCGGDVFLLFSMLVCVCDGRTFDGILFEALLLSLRTAFVLTIVDFGTALFELFFILRDASLAPRFACDFDDVFGVIGTLATFGWLLVLLAGSVCCCGVCTVCCSDIQFYTNTNLVWCLSIKWYSFARCYICVRSGYVRRIMSKI